MEIRTRSLILPLVLLIGACQPADEATTNGDDVEQAPDAVAQLDARRASYEEHYDMGHADMVADMYLEDAVALLADGGVYDGREAIAANLTRAMAASPDLALEQLDAIVSADGQMAVTIGTWDVTVTPEGGEAMTHGGHYMTANRRTDGGWMLMGVISNHDAQQSAEMLQGTMPETAPPENSQMGALLSAYEEAWNAGDPAGVAALYAEDAWAAFADLPAVQGREAITGLMEERVRGTIDIHGVRSESLGEGRMIDGGWYTISGGGAGEFNGHYWIVTETVDGEPRIKWVVSNGRPASVTASPGA